jgi:heat shock protein HslJ
LTATLLVISGSALGATQETDLSEHDLAGSSWQLVEIASMDDSVYRPEDRSLYTLALGADGTASIRADCNRGTGTWSVGESPSQIEFGVIAATQALCPEGSLHDRYMAQFQWVRSYVMEDGHLFLATMADGSIIEFEPASEAQSGPLAATVLGEEIRTANAEEMQAAILSRLFVDYAGERGIEVRDSEVAAFLAHLDLLKARDRAERTARIAEIDGLVAAEAVAAAERQSLEQERAQQAEFLASLESESDLSAEEAEELDTMRRDMAGSVIRQWKINRDLYREYGGRIIFQQAGPEPLDAYREFLEERRREGAFTIHEESFEPEFWRYFNNDEMHSFYESGSEAEAEAFDTPPWETSDEE